MLGQRGVWFTTLRWVTCKLQSQSAQNLKWMRDLQTDFRCKQLISVSDTSTCPFSRFPFSCFSHFPRFSSPSGYHIWPLPNTSLYMEDSFLTGFSICFCFFFGKFTVFPPDNEQFIISNYFVAKYNNFFIYNHSDSKEWWGKTAIIWENCSFFEKN